jgi:hypothetical protein
MARHGEEEGMHAATHLPPGLTRLWAGRIMHAHRPEGENMEVSPHVLRHTFLRRLAETKGVHEAREASGHQSDRSIWRSVKPDQQTLAGAIDELECYQRVAPGLASTSTGAPYVHSATCFSLRIVVADKMFGIGI